MPNFRIKPMQRSAIKPPELRGFNGKKPLFDVHFKNKWTRVDVKLVISGREGQSLLEALKEDPRLKVVTEMHEKYGEEIVEIWLNGRKIMEKRDDGGIQVYDDGGLPSIVNPSEDIVFLTADNLAPKEKTHISIEEDRGEKYMGEINVDSGTVLQSNESGGAHLREGDSTQGEKVDNWSIWMETEAQKTKHELVEEKDNVHKFEYVATEYKARELRSEVIHIQDINGTAGFCEHYKPEGNLEPNYSVSENIVERIETPTETVVQNPQKEEITEVKTEGIVVLPVESVANEKIELSGYEHQNFDAKEFTEEENPIIRCIMDPAFRKIYGAMYGFIDPEEIEVNSSESEPKEEKVAEVIKLEDYREERTEITIPQEEKEEEKKGEVLEFPKQRKSKPKKLEEKKKEAPKEERKVENVREPIIDSSSTNVKPKTLEEPKLEKERKTRKKPVLITRKENTRGNPLKDVKSKTLPEFKGKIPEKSELKPKVKASQEPKEERKEEKVEKKKKIKKEEPRRPPQLMEKVRGIRIPKEFRVPKLRRFEQFLVREFKISKIKVQEFKLFVMKLEKELKYEVRQFILKVKEFFKLKENLQKLKEKLGKNWVLNYTKIKLLKTVKIMDYKIKELKNEIKFRMEKIKIKIKEFVEKKLNIKLNLKEKIKKISDKLKLNEKVKLLGKLKRMVLVLLLFRWFKRK